MNCSALALEQEAAEGKPPAESSCASSYRIKFQRQFWSKWMVFLARALNVLLVCCRFKMAALLQRILRIQAIFSIYRQFFHGHCCWFQIWRQLCLAVLFFSRILKLLGERLCIDVGLLWAPSTGSAGGILPSWQRLLRLRTRLYTTINGALCFAPQKWCVFESLFEEFLKFKIVLSLLNPSDAGLLFLPLIFIDASVFGGRSWKWASWGVAEAHASLTN